MNNLFIIGNGFDKSHGLPTDYEDFHHYLLENYPDSYHDGFSYPESSMGHHGEEVFDEDHVVGFISSLISDALQEGELWRDLENALGKIDVSQYLDDYGLYEDEDDDNPYHAVYRNEDNSSNLLGAVRKITEYFNDWIKTIDLKNLKPKKDFIHLINKDNDLFLNFNYTMTLELIYKVKNVCHIHGVQGNELLFGHGSDEDGYDYYLTHYTGAENNLKELHITLKKNTMKALSSNKRFFECLSQVKCIYSYGFSFSEVDEVYIKEICNVIDTSNIVWYLNDYDCDLSLNNFKKVIQKCGFKGSFNTYHIS